MDKKELYEDLGNGEGFMQRYFGISFVKFLLLLILVLGVGIYMGMLLYGTNSLEVLLSLQDYEEHLQQDIEKLRNENAQLQKDYFELKVLSAK